jgi:hypothetical protein
MSRIITLAARYRSIPRSFFVLVGLLAASPKSRADILTYQWNDNGTISLFNGQFSVDSQRLLPNPGGPGRLFTIDALISSAFFYRPGFVVPLPGVELNIDAISTGGIALDPATGDVLSDGLLYFGPSPVYHGPGGPYQVFFAQATLDRQFDVSGGPPPAIGAESVIGIDSLGPQPRIFSVGFWDVSVQPVPAPPAVVLVGLGAGCVALRRFVGRRATA